LERQYRNRWLIGERENGARRRTFESDTINADRLRDILKLVLAYVAYIEFKLSSHLLVGIIRKADPTRVSQRLYAGGDIDAIAVDVALVDNNIANIDANTKLYAAVFLNRGVARFLKPHMRLRPNVDLESIASILARPGHVTACRYSEKLSGPTKGFLSRLARQRRSASEARS
jgi:hypothetical protein